MRESVTEGPRRTPGLSWRSRSSASALKGKVAGKHLRVGHPDKETVRL